MKLFNLSVNQLNQNGYSKNMQTKGKIGAIYTFPADYTPDDCLSCDGYSLLIVDYQDLYRVLGTKYNQSGDEAGTFRIPDYNITKRFLQPGKDVGTTYNAGLPNIWGEFNLGDSNNVWGSGAFYATGSGNWRNGGGSSSSERYIGFNASRCSGIYGASSTVQPPSQIVHYCIKYK